MLLIGGRAIGIDRLHRHKGVGIGRVGHDTYNHVRQVRGRCGTHPERELQAGEGQHRRVGQRQDGNLVAIGAGSDIRVESQ